MATTKNVTDIDALWGQTERLCRVIAPRDLGDTPLYIVPQSRLPAERLGNRLPHSLQGHLEVGTRCGACSRGQGLVARTANVICVYSERRFIARPNRL